MLPDATVAVAAAVVYVVVGYVLFYVSENWNDKEDE